MEQHHHPTSHSHAVNYAQLTLPSPRGSGSSSHRCYGSSDKVIYSQIDMSRKTSGNKGRSHVTINPYPPRAEDPLGWAPLLSHRNAPESSL